MFDYDCLHTLLNFVKINCRTSSNLDFVVEASDNSAEESAIQVMLDDNDVMCISDTQPTTTEGFEQEEEEQQEEEQTTRTSTVGGKKADPTQQILDLIIARRERKNNESASVKNHVQSPTTLFLLSLRPTLKAVPTSRQLDAKMDLMKSLKKYARFDKD